MTYDNTSQVALRERYLKLKNDLEYKTEDVAKAYLQQYHIDTSHEVVWKDDSGSKHNKEIYYALYAKDERIHLFNEPFEDKEKAKNKTKELTSNYYDEEIDIDMLDMMILKFYKHQLFVGGSGIKGKEMRLLSEMTRNDMARGETTNLERVITELKKIEKYSITDDLPARAYGSPEQYYEASETHREKIIQKYINEWNDKPTPISFTDDNTISFGRWDAYGAAEKKPKISEGKLLNKSSSFNMNFCVSIINFLEEEISPLMATAAEVLSDSHKWRIENGVEEEGSTRSALIGDESDEWPIGAKEGDYLKTTIEHMIKNNFDCQILFSSSKQCIGTLKLSKLSTEIALHKYNNIGETIDVSKLNELGLIERAPIIIDALEPLCRFSNKIGEIDVVLFRWDPMNNPLHKKLLEEKKPLLVPGIHVITSHDILAHGIYQNN